MNAWDPHSFGGNNNSYDQNLDGHIGRRTAIAVLCWPKVNTRMQRVVCDDVVPAVVPISEGGGAAGGEEERQVANPSNPWLSNDLRLRGAHA